MIYEATCHSISDGHPMQSPHVTCVAFQEEQPVIESNPYVPWHQDAIQVWFMHMAFECNSRKIPASHVRQAV